MFTSDFPITPPKNTHNNASLHNSWNQHTPEYMPWGILPQQPRVTRFSGEVDPQPCTSQEALPPLWNTHQENLWKSMTCPTSSNLKRKIEDQDEGQIKKQLITEDKISVHMSQLHIGAAPATNIQSKSDAMEEDGASCLDGVKIEAGSKLFLSEELRQFQCENSIPASLLESFNKPSMAVVLWQPRSTVHELVRHVNVLPEQSSQDPLMDNSTDDLEQSEEESNNNEPMSNLNLDGSARHIQPDLEMDDDL